MPNLTATYANPTGGENLTIEQEPWPSSRGVLTARQAMAIMVDMYQSGITPDGNLNCRDLPATINVYPQPLTLAYALHTSWGKLSGPAIADVEQVEAITVNFRNPSLPGPVQSIIKIDWLVGPFDKLGNSVPIPDWELVGNDLVFATDAAAGPVFYAGLRVKFIRHRHQYKLTLPSRSCAIENARQSTVYALFGKSKASHEVTPPPDKGICMDAEKWQGVISEIEPPDDPGDGAPINKETTYDYCDGHVVRTTII